MDTTSCSGWLSKLTINSTFGTSRWQSRYFILLDSELRYYKDEHSIVASRAINLRDIARVVITTLPNHPYTFRLEPTLYFQKHQANKKQQQKTWTMECRSEFELEAWVAAINLRLSKLIFFQESEQEVQIVHQTDLVFPFSISEKKHNPTLLLRALTTSSHSSNSSSSSGSSICSNEEATPQPRPLRRSKPSISRRRGMILSPLEMETIPGLENDILSSSSSRNSSIPSPFIEASSSISNETIIEEMDEEELSSETIGQANKATVQNAYLIDASSPTFAFYKERFHL